MDRNPRVIEHGRAPGSRDGSRRPLAPLAEHLLQSIPDAVLVTLHSRRPAGPDDDLLVWASIWFRGRSKGKVPERKVPAEVLQEAPIPLAELERFELEALVLELTGSLPDDGWHGSPLGPLLSSAGSRPRLRVLRSAHPSGEARPSGEEEVPAPAPAPVVEESVQAEREQEHERTRMRGFLRVLDGGLS